MPEIVHSDYEISEDGDDLLEDQLMEECKKACKSVEIDMKEKGKQLAGDRNGEPTKNKKVCMFDELRAPAK